MKAANQGDNKALYHLADCYYEGKGVNEDKRKALELFFKAAEQMYAPALCKLGDYYYNGIEVEHDDERASHYYRMAAMKGDIWNVPHELLLIQECILPIYLESLCCHHNSFEYRDLPNLFLRIFFPNRMY